MLEPDKCEDPHVERLLEAFAFLAARVHLKIDDEFPEITEALLSILYPHYLRPIPSMSVAEFQVDPEQVKPEAGLKVERGSVLYSRPVGGVPCKFRTCYDITFWPVTVAEAEWKTPDRLQPPIKAPEAVAARAAGPALPGRPDVFQALARFAALLPERREQPDPHALRAALQQLRADPGARPDAEVQAAARSCCRRRSLRPVGFGEDEGMLPYSRRSFTGYRLLQEYFCFPQKFFFIDLSGLDQVGAAGFGAAPRSSS